MNLLLFVLRFVLTSALLEPLEDQVAPDGWAGMKFQLLRDERTHGMSYTGTSDFTFWKQSGAYLRTLYEGGTVQNSAGADVIVPAAETNAVAVLNVFEADPNDFRTALVLRYRVDFTQYRAIEAGGTQVKLAELGIANKLLDRSSLPVDLLGSISIGGQAVSVAAGQSITLHSQVLRLAYEASNKASNDLSPGYGSGPEADLSHEQILYFGFDTQVTNDLGLEPISGGFVAGDRYTVVPIYVAKESGAFTIALDIRAHMEAHNFGNGPEFETVEGDCYLRIVRAGTNLLEEKLIPDFYSGNLGGDFTNDILSGPRTFTQVLQPGDEIYLYARYFVHNVGGLGTSVRYRTTSTATMLLGSYLRITADSTTPATTCFGVPVHETLRRLSEAMADKPNCFYSAYYGRTDSQPIYPVDGAGSLRFITNGFGLRGFPTPAATYVVGTDGVDPRKPLTTDFQTVYQALDAIDCLGLGLEQRNGQPTLRIEPRSYFYQSTVALALGRVTDLVKAPYTPLLYNQVQVGYQHWQSGAAVGLDEFNSQRTYTLPTEAGKGTYSLLSSVNTGGYLIEQARRQQFQQGTNQEGQADQELFLICLRRTAGGGLTTEKNEAFSSVTGILDPVSTYNLRLSPGRMLRKHGAWLRSGLRPQALANRSLTRAETQGNDKLVSKLSIEATAVDEHADVAINSLPVPYVIAETYEFTAKLRLHERRRLVNAPYGLITFLDASGQKKAGYLLKMDCEPASGKASFTLLRAANVPV